MNKKIILALIAFVAVVGILVGVWLATKPQTQEGSKQFTVAVVHGDGTQQTFSYATDEALLGAYLEGQGLIDSEGSDPGMFHTVDGEKADWNTNQSYWAFYVGEDYASVGIFDQPIQGGAQYKLVYTIG